MQITPELVLLRTALASPSLRPGAVVAARVLDRGVLSLLGARVPATLPEDVRPGDVLRLTVKEAGPDRILLQVVQQPPPVATPPVMMPGGATARVIQDEDEQAGGGARGERAVTLRYDSATLGRLDIKIPTGRDRTGRIGRARRRARRTGGRRRPQERTRCPGLDTPPR
jgi:hypothetical protein